MIRIFRCLIGQAHVYDGSICWFSKTFFDAHDYHVHKGGTGEPIHFQSYQCHKCGKEFYI